MDIKRRIKTAFFSASILMASAQAFAADAYTNFAEYLKGMETLSGKFQQEIYDQEGVEIQKTNGDFKVKRPGYFWWNVAPPYEQLVVGTPDNLQIYDPDLEQLTIHEKDSLAGSPALLMSGDIEAIKKSYDISESKNKDQVTFNLKHKSNEESPFDTLALVFIEKEGKKNTADQTSASEKFTSQLRHMNFTDKLGQRTNVTFSELVPNVSLDIKAFLFEAPEGTDVIVDGP